MKKLLFASVVLASVFAGCTPSTKDYNIQINHIKPSFNDSTVYLVDILTQEKIDSATVKEGTVQFSKELKNPFIAQSLILMFHQMSPVFLVEGTDPITIDLENKTIESKGELLNKWKNFMDSNKDTQSLKEAFSKFHTAFLENQNNLLGECYGLNLLSLISPNAFFLEDQEFVTELTPDDILEKLPKESRNKKVLAELRDMYYAYYNHVAGKPYTDIEGVDYEGNPISLSSLIDQKEYTLVYFWDHRTSLSGRAIFEKLETMQAENSELLQVVNVEVKEQSIKDKEQIHNSIDMPQIYKANQAAKDYGCLITAEYLLINKEGDIVIRTPQLSKLADFLKSK